MYMAQSKNKLIVSSIILKRFSNFRKFKEHITKKGRSEIILTVISLYT